MNPVTQVDPATRIVDLTYEVEPGQEGPLRAHRDLGQRQDPRQGDPARAAHLRGRAVQLHRRQDLPARVTALGFFETVDITTKPGSSDETMVAKVEVKEKSTGTFQLGRRLLLLRELHPHRADLAEQLLRLGPDPLALRSSGRRIRQLGQIQFVDPYFLDTKWTFAFDLYATEGHYSRPSTRRAVGGSVTWGYELSGLAWLLPWTRAPGGHAPLRHLHQRVRDGDAQRARHHRCSSTASAPAPPARSRFALPVGPARQSALPQPGLLRPDLRRAGARRSWRRPPSSANNVNLFNRYSLDLRGYHPVALGIIARAKLRPRLHHRVGRRTTGCPSRSSTTWAAINSVRGYRLLSISPVSRWRGRGRTTPSLVATSTAGRQQAAHAQPRARVRPSSRSWASASWSSSTWATPSRRAPASDPSVPLSLYKSWGFGLRWFSPIGPLRFEWGFPLNRRFDRLTRHLHRQRPSTSSSPSATSSDRYQRIRHAPLHAPRRLAALALVLSAAPAARPRRDQDRLRRPAARPQRGRRGQGRQGQSQEGVRGQKQKALDDKKTEFERLRGRSREAGVAHERGGAQAEGGRAREEGSGAAGLLRAACRRSSPTASAR